jgi:hypothetical protein
MRFIYILEGKIGRLEAGITPVEVVGLCTDNFSSCNIIVLISADRRRCVLIHGDMSVTEAVVLNEIRWVGGDWFTKIIVSQR